MVIKSHALRSIIAIHSIDFKTKEENSLLDKRYRLDMIKSVSKRGRGLAEANPQR